MVLFHSQKQETMMLNLKENCPEKIWEEIFSKKGDGVPRKYIKRFERDEIKIREVESIDDLRIFYKYYAENLKFINVEPSPLSYFEYCWNLFSSSERRITLLYKNYEIFGGLFAFIYPAKKTMYLNYLALNRNIPNTYHPPYPLYWDAILKASEMDLDYVCFGSTPNNINNITYRTKMKFGCEYKEEYRMMFPLSKLFKLGYQTYSYMKKRN